MSLISSVYQSLKRKRSDLEKAEKIGIPLKKYLALKELVVNAISDISPVVDTHVVNYLQRKLVDGEESITLLSELDENLGKIIIDSSKSESATIVEQHVDLETGTTKITGLFATEPRSAEEIISLLNIDTKKWKLSQYWNKEKSGRWYVSALVSKLPEEHVIQSTFLEILQNYELPEIQPLDKSNILLNKSSEEKVCGVFSLQDLHFGKPGNENLGEILESCVKSLLTKAYNTYYLDEIIFVVGGDALNMDTFNGTTTKGTIVENGEGPVETYIKAFDSLMQTIGTISQFCNKLKIVFLPGNHDRLSSFHLVHAIQQGFKDWSNIEFDSNYAERKVHVYGSNMFCFEHGDVSSKNNPLVYATEFPTQWGSALYRTLYVGHYHTKRSKEYLTENEENGFTTRQLPSLSSSDYYHYHNKWTGNKRAGILELHCEKKGKVSEFVYTL